MSNAPLPSGLPDVLPPFAAQEFRVIHHMLRAFTQFGYKPVIPPLMEYETSLLADQGAATARQVFRVMDPASREMLAFRADMTTQISRIAEQPLRSVERPLRLSYAGYTLRAAPEALRTRRQHTQIGIELFGASTIAYDAEVIAVPLEALSSLSLSELSLDVSAPFLLESLLSSIQEGEQALVREAANRKDVAALQMLKAPLVADIVEAAGPAEIAIPTLKKLATQHAALSKALDMVQSLLEALSSRGVTTPTTIDLLETRGFGYYSGLAFSLFLRNPALEIGRGGHYRTTTGEDAVGFTFYIDDILAALGNPNVPKLLGISGSTTLSELRNWHQKGYETLLIYSEPMVTEAKRLGCSHALIDGAIVELS